MLVCCGCGGSSLHAWVQLRCSRCKRRINKRNCKASRVLILVADCVVSCLVVILQSGVVVLSDSFLCLCICNAIRGGGGKSQKDCAHHDVGCLEGLYIYAPMRE